MGNFRELGVGRLSTRAPWVGNGRGARLLEEVKEGGFLGDCVELVFEVRYVCRRESQFAPDFFVEPSIPLFFRETVAVIICEPIRDMNGAAKTGVQFDRALGLVVVSGPCRQLFREAPAANEFRTDFRVAHPQSTALEVLQGL
jgi:hypothetical protein